MRWRGFGSRTSLSQSPTYKFTAKRKPKYKNGYIQIKAKFSGRCKCGNKIRKGKMIWFNKETRRANCYPCGPHNK